MKDNEILKKIVRITKNPFLILSISLFLSLILISLILVNNVYKSEQKEGYVEDMFSYGENRPGVHLSWKIFKDTFVSGDFIQFRFEPFDTNISDNNSIEDWGLSIKYSMLSAKDYLNCPFPYKTIFNYSFIPREVIYPLYIEGPGSYYIVFKASLTNINTGEVIVIIPYTLDFAYRSISYEEYRRRLYEKLLILFALISLSLAISFTSVKNLMEIWDRKIK